MEFTFGKAFIACIAVTGVLFFVYFCLTGSNTQRRIGRLLIASLGAGIVAGFALAVATTSVVPTVITVHEDQSHDKVYRTFPGWQSHLGATMLQNDYTTDLELYAVEYGTGHVSGASSFTLPQGKLTRITHSPDGYFYSPPRSIRSKSRGEVKWYIREASDFFSY